MASPCCFFALAFEWPRLVCGGFNSSIAKMCRLEARRLIKTGKQVKILCVGTKAYDQLKTEFRDMIIDVISLKDVKRIGFENAYEIASKVTDMFDKGEIDVVKLYFAEFKSVISLAIS